MLQCCVGRRHNRSPLQQSDLRFALVLLDKPRVSGFKHAAKHFVPAPREFLFSHA